MWWRGETLGVYIGLGIGHLILLILAVRSRNGHNRVRRWLEVNLALSLVWVVSLASLELLTTGNWWAWAWHRTVHIGLTILALTTAEFSDAFAELPPLRLFRVGLVGLLALIAVALDTLPAYLPAAGQTIPYLGRSYTTLATLFWATAWLTSTLTAWWTALLALRQAIGAKHRNRIRYLTTALAAFAVGDLLLWIGGVPDRYVGLAARLFGAAVLCVAALRHNLPDLRRSAQVVLRAVLLIILTALLYLVILLPFGLFSGLLPWGTETAFALPPLFLALMVAAAVETAINTRLRHFLDRRIMGQDYDVQKALRRYSEQVGLILDLDRLADTTLNWLTTTMHARHASFILLTPQDDDRIELKVLRTTADSYPPPVVWSMDNRFILHFYKVGRPLSQYDLDMLTWFETLSDSERGWLRSLIAELYIPVQVADWPAALLALGPKVGGQPYDEEDIETLMLLAGQTATALENARLMGDLRTVQVDLQRLNEELAETNRQLARLDQTKTDFITIASHELRTPLTQIYGYSDFLARMGAEGLDNAQIIQEFIEGISRGAARLKDVVDAMVDVSLIETGALKIQTALIPVRIVVENAIETVRRAAEERSLQITTRDLGDLPYIQADGARLEQVFVSLLSNAVKFTPDNGKIEISGRLTSQASKAYVEILVSDTGIGIDPDQQDLIFEKFYRAENPMLHSTDSTRFKGAGPGLGLAIAKGIVEAHEGRIWVESPGRDEETCPGSTFHVLLPLTGPEGEKVNETSAHREG